MPHYPASNFKPNFQLLSFMIGKKMWPLQDFSNVNVKKQWPNTIAYPEQKIAYPEQTIAYPKQSVFERANKNTCINFGGDSFEKL